MERAGGGRGPPKGKSKGAGAGAGGGPVRKRVRGLERLLQRGGLPDDVRCAKEAELAALKGEAVKKRKVERERHFSKKYHGVKFIERRKVERRIAQLKRQLGAGSAAVEAELREAEHDLLYIRHFPRSKKYLALFPAEGADDPYVAKRRSRLRALIVRRVEAGLPVGEALDGGDEEGASDEEAIDAEVEAAVPMKDDGFFAADDGADDDEAEPPPVPLEDDGFFAADAADGGAPEAGAAVRSAGKPKKRKRQRAPP